MDILARVGLKGSKGLEGMHVGGVRDFCIVRSDMLVTVEKLLGIDCDSDEESSSSMACGSHDDSCRTPPNIEEEAELSFGCSKGGYGNRDNDGGKPLVSSPVSVVGNMVEFAYDRPKRDVSFEIPFRIHSAGGDSLAKQQDSDSSAQPLLGEIILRKDSSEPDTSLVPSPDSDADSLTYSVSQDVEEYGEDCSAASLGSLSYSTASDAEYLEGGSTLQAEDGFHFSLD